MKKVWLMLIGTVMALYASQSSEAFYYSFEKKYQDRVEVYDHDICSMTRKTTTFNESNRTITEYIVKKPANDVLLEFTFNQNDTFRLCKDAFALNLYSYVIYDENHIAKNDYWLANHPNLGIKENRAFVQFSYNGKEYALEQKLEPNAPLVLQNSKSNTTRVIADAKGSILKAFEKVIAPLPEGIHELYAYGRYTIRSYKKQEMISIVDVYNKKILYYKIGDAPDSPLVYHVYNHKEGTLFMDATEQVTRFELQSSKRDIVLGYDVGYPSYLMHFSKKGDTALVVLHEFDTDNNAYETLYTIDLQHLQISKLTRYARIVPEDYEGVHYRYIRDAIFSANNKDVIVFFNDGKCREIK